MQLSGGGDGHTVESEYPSNEVSSGGTSGTVVHPAVVELTGGEDPASITSVTQLVTFINTALATQGLITASGSGETILTATSSAISLTGGGPQTTATGTTTYTWDVLGRLKGVALPSGPSYGYQYDYRTRRIGIQQAAHESQAAKYTAIVFSGGLSLAEYESGTAITTPSSPAASTVRYLRGPDMGGGVGGLLSSRRVGVTKYNLSNGRGDVVAQSDETATLTWTASYEAYGKRTKETGENQDKQRANTKDEDPTGLLNEGFRYRDIETGMWLSRDPAGFVDGPNLYAYVKQNPWTGWDPLGLAALNHTTDSVDAEKMIKEGFKPNKNGLRWATSPDIAGEGARKSGVNLNYDVQIEKLNIKEITTDQMSAWKKQARTEILADGVKNGSPEFGSRYGARLNELRTDWMVSQKGVDGFVMSGEKGVGKLYAFTEQGWQKGGARLMGFSGAESAALMKKMWGSEKMMNFAGKAAPYAKIAQRGLIAVGVATDAYEIYTAEDKARTVTTVAGGWAGAYVGGKTGTAAGAAVGVWCEGVGAVPGAFFGGLVGSVSGYFAGREVTETVYDWSFSKGTPTK